MTVECYPTIALVLVLVSFLIGFKKWCINKQGIGVGLIIKSN